MSVTVPFVREERICKNAKGAILLSKQTEVPGATGRTEEVKKDSNWEKIYCNREDCPDAKRVFCEKNTTTTKWTKYSATCSRLFFYYEESVVHWCLLTHQLALYQKENPWLHL